MSEKAVYECGSLVKNASRTLFSQLGGKFLRRDINIECQSRSQTEIKLTKTKSIFTLECSGIFKSDLSDTQKFENR